MEPDEEWSNVYFDRSEVAQMESPRAGAACAVMPFADGEEEGSTVVFAVHQRRFERKIFYSRMNNTV